MVGKGVMGIFVRFKVWLLELVDKVIEVIEDDMRHN